MWFNAGFLAYVLLTICLPSDHVHVFWLRKQVIRLLLIFGTRLDSFKGENPLPGGKTLAESHNTIQNISATPKIEDSFLSLDASSTSLFIPSTRLFTIEFIYSASLAIPGKFSEWRWTLMEYCVRFNRSDLRSVSSFSVFTSASLQLLLLHRR